MPMRTEGREHFHEERFYLGLYLLALGTHGLLGYPFQVEQGRQHESPDFMLTWSTGEVTGLEVTRATTQEAQRGMTQDQREYLRREAALMSTGQRPEPVIRLGPLRGWIGDEPEVQCCSLFREAIEKKLAKLADFRPAARYDLLIWDDAPLPASRGKVIEALRPWVRSLDTGALKLGVVSLVISLDVAFDLAGSSRLLPYVEWDTPENGLNGSSDLTERIEYAGWHAAKRALRGHAEEHNPVYSMDSRGRLVKQTADGQRFEVRVGEDGAEVVVARLS